MSIDYVGAVNTIRRNPELVFHCLRQFFVQKYKPNFVYLIDQNPMPMTLPSDLLALGEKIRHLHVAAPSPSAARNQLPEDVGHEWILFCDDDGYLDSSYSEHWFEVLSAQPGLEVISGPYIDPETKKYYSPRFEIGGNLGSILGSKLLIGGNFAIRAKSFNQIGRYDERFGPGAYWAANEETDLAWKGLAQGIAMQYSRDMVVFHPAPHHADTVLALKKAYQYAIGRGALAGKWSVERPSWVGLWELFEMFTLPWVNLLRGVLRGEFRQIPIQLTVLVGRAQGLLEFLVRKIIPGLSL